MLGGIRLRGRTGRLCFHVRLRERLEIAPRLRCPGPLRLQADKRAGGARENEPVGLVIDDKVVEGTEAVLLQGLAGDKIDRGEVAGAVANPDPIPHHGEDLPRASIGPEELAGLGRIAAEPLFAQRHDEPVAGHERAILLRLAVEEHAPVDAQLGPGVERIDPGQIAVDGRGEDRGATRGERTGLRAVEVELVPLPVAVALLERGDLAVTGRPDDAATEGDHRALDDPAAVEGEGFEAFGGVHPGPLLGRGEGGHGLSLAGSRGIGGDGVGAAGTGLPRPRPRLSRRRADAGVAVGVGRQAKDRRRALRLINPLAGHGATGDRRFPEMLLPADLASRALEGVELVAPRHEDELRPHRCRHDRLPRRPEMGRPDHLGVAAAVGRHRSGVDGMHAPVTGLHDHEVVVDDDMLDPTLRVVDREGDHPFQFEPGPFGGELVGERPADPAGKSGRRREAGRGEQRQGGKHRRHRPGPKDGQATHRSELQNVPPPPNHHTVQPYPRDLARWIVPAPPEAARWSRGWRW